MRHPNHTAEIPKIIKLRRFCRAWYKRFTKYSKTVPMSFMYVLFMEDNCISTFIHEMDIGNFLQFEYSEIIRWNQNNVLNKAKKKTIYH